MHRHTMNMATNKYVQWIWMHIRTMNMDTNTWLLINPFIFHILTSILRVSDNWLKSPQETTRSIKIFCIYINLSYAFCKNFDIHPFIRMDPSPPLCRKVYQRFIISQLQHSAQSEWNFDWHNMDYKFRHSVYDKNILQGKYFLISQPNSCVRARSP